MRDGGPHANVGDRVPLTDTRIDSRSLDDGERVLAHQTSDRGVYAVSSIGGDHVVNCVYAPSFRLPEADAVKAALSETCDADLRSRGLPPEEECTGCHASGVGSASSGAPWLVLASALALGTTRARRRFSRA
jgi:hypothetical protein